MNRIANLIAGRSMGLAKAGIWDGLNEHLLGHIYKLKKEGQGWVVDNSAPAVIGALTETTLEIALNWQSPFENSGSESQAPALAAMLQTGSLQPLVTALTGSGEEGAGAVVRKNVNTELSSFEGRTGITKLNSQQVFNGMQPIKISTTLILRAWRDPQTEVEDPLNQLMQWLLPEKLSADGSVIARGVSTAGGNSNYIEMLMPSLAPSPVSLRYKNRVFKEMVIEGASINLDSPIDVKGRFVQLSLPLTFCSLTAIDHHDWKAYGTI